MIQGDLPNLVSRLVITTNCIIRTRKLGETYAYVLDILRARISNEVG